VRLCDGDAESEVVLDCGAVSESVLSTVIEEDGDRRDNVTDSC
jgi:hypothetical protein